MINIKVLAIYITTLTIHINTHTSTYIIICVVLATWHYHAHLWHLTIVVFGISHVLVLEPLSIALSHASLLWFAYALSGTAACLLYTYPPLSSPLRLLALTFVSLNHSSIRMLIYPYCLYVYLIRVRLLLNAMHFSKACANSGFISTSSCLPSSAFSFLVFRALLIFSYMPSASSVYSTSPNHCLSKCTQSFSSGRYVLILSLPLAYCNKSYTVSPSMCGIEDTLTLSLLIYYADVRRYPYLHSSLLSRVAYRNRR